MNIAVMPDFSEPARFEFVATLDRLRRSRDTFRSSARPLSPDEISRLEQRGNTAQNWLAIRVAPDFSTDHIANSRFFGTCHLGVFHGTPVELDASLSLPSGIHDSIIISSVIGDECCIWNARGVSNYFIDSAAALYNTGTVSCSPTTVFGNGRKIVIGMETGGREVRSYADITIPIASLIAHDRSRCTPYEDFVNAYLERLATSYGIIGGASRICNCPRIIDSFFGNGARCGNATLIAHSTIASSTDEPVVIDDGALVRDSIVQWGCSVASMAIVDCSVCTEHSHVERHAKVTHSIIGPNTGIAEGEVTSSLVGPFVGFHHQALLIGALWPEGRGNVAYGANVGSNHTAKAPDQEIYCGEGLFFGLGVNIKFPADFSRAPYTIIATGVTTLPQRMSFPFSLINSPSRRSHDLPPAYNELVPGWVLSDNLYAVYRNEAKFRSRDTARRSSEPFEMFRPQTIDMLVTARDALQRVDAGKEYYTDKDIPGAGKNFITAQSRETAIATYSRHIELYCMNGLFTRWTSRATGNGAGDYTLLMTTPDGNPRWEHERALCSAEGFDRRSLRENLERLAELVGNAASAVLAAKEKDDRRGMKIMADYSCVHQPAAQDTFIKNLTETTDNKRREIQSMLSPLT